MSEFYEGMAELLQVDATKIKSDYVLNSGESVWDSLAIVSTLALVDDCFGVMLDGKTLAECKTIADIESLIASAKKG